MGSAQPRRHPEPRPQAAAEQSGARQPAEAREGSAFSPQGRAGGREQRPRGAFGDDTIAQSGIDD